jgi:hypothetical protein
MDGAFWRIMASIALVVTCSCAAKKPNIHEDRKHYTGIEANERVVIVLNSFRSYDKSIASEEEEKSIQNCVSKGMMRTNQWLKIVSTGDFRRNVFPNKKFEDSLCSPEPLLYFLSDPNTQNRLTELGVRYVIIVSVTTSESEALPDFAAHELMCMCGGKWTKYYSMTADVLDVKYLRESGSVTASSEGERGCGCFTGVLTGVGGCLPVPPIPFYYAERTEAEVCPALGEGVMKFIIDGHDMVPTPELGTGIDSRGVSPDTQTEPRSGSEEDLLKRTQEPGRYDKDSQK